MSNDLSTSTQLPSVGLEVESLLLLSRLPTANAQVTPPRLPGMAAKAMPSCNYQPRHTQGHSAGQGQSGKSRVAMHTHAVALWQLSI